MFKNLIDILSNTIIISLPINFIVSTSILFLNQKDKMLDYYRRYDF